MKTSAFSFVIIILFLIGFLLLIFGSLRLMLIGLFLGVGGLELQAEWNTKELAREIGTSFQTLETRLITYVDARIAQLEKGKLD